MMVGCHLLVLLPERFRAPMRLQQVADALAPRGVLLCRNVNGVLEDL